jgi:hypothetical protein
MLSEQDEGAEGFHALNLTSGVGDGKRWKKIERNAQKKPDCEILSLIFMQGFLNVARYFSTAQHMETADLRAGTHQ